MRLTRATPLVTPGLDVGPLTGPSVHSIIHLFGRIPFIHHLVIFEL